MQNCFFLFCFLCSFSTVAQNFQVGHTTINFSDSVRNNRVIQTELYYPAGSAGTDVPIANGKFPVIICGHGFVMIWSAYQNLWDDFVPKGYIMAFPRTEGNISPSHSEFAKDLRFLVSAMQKEGNNNNSLFYNSVENKTAIMGHSMGGGSAILASANNTEIETVIAFSPAETNPSAIASSDSIAVDALIMVGAQDGVAPPSTHAIPMYDSLGAACKTFISITGGAHCYFANSNFNCDFGESTASSGITVTRAQQQDITSDFVSLWLDYKLKNNCNAFDVFNDSLDSSPRITKQQSCSFNPVPVITFSNDTLYSTAGTAFQWYLNDSIIPGATNQQYVPVDSGNYSVEVTYSNGCSEISENYFFSILKIPGQLSSFNFSFYPNPVGNILHVSIGKSTVEKISFSIYNGLGQNLLRAEKYTSNGELDFAFDLSLLTEGIYFITLDSENIHYYAHIIKQ